MYTIALPNEQVLLSVFLLFFTSWKLSLVMMAVVPVLVAVTRVYGVFVRRFSKQYQVRGWVLVSGSCELEMAGLGSRDWHRWMAVSDWTVAASC